MSKDWYCKSCPAWASTVTSRIPAHKCPGLALGLLTPLVEVGVASKLEIVERGDFVGSELVQTSATGRPVAAVVTTYDDRQDCNVFAPTARTTKE